MDNQKQLSFPVFGLEYCNKITGIILWTYFVAYLFKFTEDSRANIVQPIKLSVQVYVHRSKKFD